MKSSWRKILVFLSFVVIVVIAIVNLGQFKAFISLINNINVYILIFVVIVQAISYYANAKYYQSVLSIYNYKIAFKLLYELALSVNFVNTVFPSWGLSGISHLSHQLLNRVPVGKTTLMQLFRYLFTYISFLGILLCGFLLLFLSGDINKITVKILLLLVLTILVGSGLAISIIKDRNRVEKIFCKIISIINYLYKKLKGKNIIYISETKKKRFINEFYHGYSLLSENPKEWLKPLKYTLLGGVAEVITVYIVFLALNSNVNLGAVIIAYVLANLFSFISFFIGGIGFYEATMVTSLVILGMPLTVSLSVTIVYRIFTFIIFMPIGFYFYRKHSLGYK